MNKLNDKLQPLNSPVANYQGAVSAFEFNAGNERNTVDLSRIKNFNFSSGTGGTLVLGGPGNGNGLMNVKNSIGTTIVQADNTGLNVYNTSGSLITSLNASGLTIYRGNVTIQNANNTTILDTSGIVSTANFAADNVEDVTIRTTTSTSPTDLPGSTLDTFVLSRAVKAAVYVTVWGYNIAWLADASIMQVQCVDNIDGTLVAFPLYVNQQLTEVGGGGPPFTAFGYNIDYQFNSAAAIVDLSAGTHTMKLQFYITGTGTAEVALYQLGYVILGS